jgi:Cys-rich protein (TIGR01571 family)
LRPSSHFLSLSGLGHSWKEAHHHGWHDDDDDDDDDLFHKLPEECKPMVALSMSIVFTLAVVTVLLVAVYFAKRRAAIRAAFGIDGSLKEDVLLWTCCAPCALAQETRTLMHAHVHEGIWYGGHPEVHVPTAFSPPAVHKMAPV